MTVLRQVLLCRTFQLGSPRRSVQRLPRLSSLSIHTLAFCTITGPYCRSISTDSEESDDDEFELRPLIKEELRNTIQKRRWQLGLLDWGLEDYDKKRTPKDNQLTREELMKREDRKNRNRLAAAKCRQKRRSRLDELQRTMDSLEIRRDELMAQKEKLSQEKAQLHTMVEEHFKLCKPSMLRTT